MKLAVAIVGLVAALALSALAFYGVPQETPAAPQKTVDKPAYTCPMHPDVKSDKPGKCPTCGMNLVKKQGTTAQEVGQEMPTTPQSMMQSPMGMMKNMGMSDAMMKRCRLMMSTPINPYDPAALLAVKGDLNLTDDQVAKLKSIMDKAREDAKNLLTDDQNKKLEEVAKRPDTMMEMCQQMMPMMQKMMGEKGTGGQMMMCPMMKSMMGGMGMQPSGAAQRPRSLKANP